MISTRTKWMLGAVVLAVLPAAPARAELYKDVARGLALFDFRFSGERNLLGDGITANAFASYNNRRFNFGVADLTLTGVIGMSGGFTRRGIPGAEFSLNTGNQPLSYTFDLNNGIQDLTATGRVLIDINTDINALGFYDQTLQISNRGTFTTDGFGVEETGTLDLDIGPIDVSGNIFADTLAVLTDPFFQATGTENVFAKFSNRATKLASATKNVNTLKAKLAVGEVLTDDEVAALVNNSVIAAVLGGEPSEGLFDGLLLPADLLESEDGTVSGFVMSSVPEPAVLIMMTLGAVAVLPRRRKRAV
jgi:hypothetical protein